MKSGFIGIIGRANAGKSTLLNNIIGTKIAITSPCVQTTRNSIQGVYNEKDCQIVFIDTPGIHKPQHLLGNKMNRLAYNTIHDVDVIYYIVSGDCPFGKGDEFVIDILKNVKTPVFLLFNKIDTLTSSEVIDGLIQWEKRYPFKEIFPISALKNKNIERLIETTKIYLKDGIAYFPLDVKTNHSKQFFISELIREKIIFLTKQDIPHSIACVIEKMVEQDDKLIIDALILVERKSQKPIIIGKQGRMIKQIGINLRKDLELIFQVKVFVSLYVRVEEKWRNKESKLKQLGFNEYE